MLKSAKIRWYFLLLLFISVLGRAGAQEDQFTEANELYRQGDFPGAIQIYHSILESGAHSADLYYNMGNAYYQNNQLANAILHFEKALKLAPNHRLAKRNLTIAEREVRPEISVIPEFFLLNYWQTASNWFSAKTWAIFNFITIICVAAGLWMFLMAGKLQIRKLGFYLTVIFVILSVLIFLLSGSKMHYETDYRFAVVMESDTSLMSGPDIRSHTVMELGEGIKVKLIDEIGEWCKVELRDKEQGWLREDQIGKI